VEGPKPRPQLFGGVSASQIRAQLQDILASDIFARSERLSKFLRYVVEETLHGNGGVLKEQVIAHDLYERGHDYDPNADPVVRVDARRLRDKLREYYAQAQNEPVVITLPKGSYVPAFELNPANRPVMVVPRVEPIVFPARRRGPRRNIVAAGAMAVVLAAAGVWYLANSSRPATTRIRPLTSLPGLESAPSLSPDGNFVVFAWANGGPPDLYVKAVDGESLRQLTSTPQPEFSPAWAPDGREIAFVRGRQGVFVMSALGGVERKVTDGGTHVRWAADSKSVFVRVACGSADEFCIDRIRLDTLERRRIVEAGAGGSPRGGGWTFNVSPDGSTLAFIGTERPGVADVYLVPAEGGGIRRLTELNAVMNGVDWTPHGKSLIYSADPGQSGRFRLWRIPAGRASGPGEALTGEQGESAEAPSIARATRGYSIRVAYTGSVRNIRLRVLQVQLTGPSNPIGTAIPLADQTNSHDCSGSFSPDGEQYVFRSYRSGEPRLWIVRRDGSGLHSLTTHAVLKGRPYTSAWSRDGRHIAFEWVTPDGNNDIYITDVAGGQPRRMTDHRALDTAPAWSLDGQTIYFTSDRSRSFQVWKQPVTGGSAVPVSPGFGFEPQLSPDGKYVYYMSCLTGTPCPLKRISTSGGPESVVLDGVISTTWSVTPTGIYFLSREGEKDWLDRFDPATGKRSRLGMLPFRPNFGGLFCGFVSVAPDGGTVIGNHVDRFDSNLMVLDISQ
jgi:Tol biopolymer transport system component